jgi:hypothetical protein
MPMRLGGDAGTQAATADGIADASHGGVSEELAGPVRARVPADPLTHTRPRAAAREQMNEETGGPRGRTREVAKHLHRFAFDCIEREYPNKPGQVLEGDADLRPPRELHPCFYGCFDWHSAVHGHWTLVTLLRLVPELAVADAVVAKLRRTLTRENVHAEVRYLEEERHRTFERPYGWAWLLKLAEALRAWEHPAAAGLSAALLPLERLIAKRFVEFLEVLRYPVRAGTHTNTAFALSFAHGWARHHDPALARAIERRARDYYLEDRSCPIGWEPGGFDFLSPCLEEAALMLEILAEGEFRPWLDAFLPGFAEHPRAFLEPVAAADPSDAHIAHLDGLNFTRAACLFQLGRALGNEAMIELGVQHFEHAYARLDAEEYAGAHWLASMAVRALEEAGAGLVRGGPVSAFRTTGSERGCT